MQETKIIISLHKRILSLQTAIGNTIVFPIAIGKPDTPTPQGYWKIQNKKILSDFGVFGTYWMGLNQPGYGIHGTNQPELIGQAVSGGCIRMHNTDIQTLFPYVHIGTPIIITD